MLTSRTFLLAAVVYGVVCALLYGYAARANGGRFVYPLDDTYIGMAMAKNLALHGTWGVNQGEFASASSTPLWMTVQSLVFRVFGVREGVPAAMGFVSGLLLLLVCDALLSNLGVGAWLRLATLGLMIFSTPMPLLALSGMEHLLHAVLTVLLVYGAASILAKEKNRLSVPSLVLLLIAASVAVRFETLFLVALLAVFLLIQKRWGLACAVVASGAATVLFTGAISISHGWFWLPATVLVKGQLPPITGPHSYLAFGGRWLKQLYGTPHLAVLIAGIAAISLYRTWPRLRPQSASDWMPVLAIGLVLLHLQFAATGGVMRYEAYLVALGVFVVASGAEYLLHHFQKTRRQAMAVGAIALALLAPLAARSMEGLKMVRHASHDIFEQQFQMAEFLSRNYKHASVAANDIGAITFFADIRCFDLAGLANLRVAQARWQRNYDTALMEEEAESRRVRLAVLYDSWFDGKFLPIAPRSWTPVERWTVPRNYVLGGATVTFYATHPGEVDELSRRLRDFDPRLPDGVTTWRR